MILIFALVILAGLTGAWYLVRSISQDLRRMEPDDQETLQNIEIWRAGK